MKPIAPVPTMDAARFDNHQDSSAPKELITIMASKGFCYLTNHGVPEPLIYQIHDLAYRFFDLPQPSKEQIVMAKAGRSWRGYFRLEQELTQGVPDYKEGLYLGRDHCDQHIEVKKGTATFGKNQWLDHPTLAGFPEAVSEYLDHMYRIGTSLLRAISLGLELSPSYFQDLLEPEATELFRIFHYPALAKLEARDSVAEHTDMGFLTILWQDSIGGLWIKDLDGTWQEAPPVPGTFVINIGDMLEYWTKGRVRATPHKVRNLAGVSRLSFPYFLDPYWHQRLKTDFAGAPPQDRRRWDKRDIHSLPDESTYGTFVWDKIKEVFPNLV